MDHQLIGRKQVIYLISGPLGVGKSTTSKALAQTMQPCVLIEGDHILHMFQGYSTSWEERLRLSWKNILALTRNFIQDGFDVVVDFVVEDELAWFCSQVADLPANLNYVALMADEPRIIERLHTRGDIQCLDRSLFLRNQMLLSPSNQPFLYDTTMKDTAQIVEDIIAGDRFRVSY
ncbi:AAA family ATPase [Paenibacillus rhizovicinus]|uniref:AAA family ATPase n=1 Tax=Paenibacillus rhizovicinus TaxID=2704463 RepID=A0A6C0P2W6_9BACL|nr:AAA family ATPase [Paenibacillus rhizovicinus]QHW32910.1 AAA family ATPase [Paenibacillus rhizovicinus]